MSRLPVCSLEWTLGWIYVVAFFQKGPNCTFLVSNWLVLLDLEWESALRYVVVFQRQGRKSSFSVPNVTLSYSVLLNVEWTLGWINVLSFFQKGPNCTFQVSNWLVYLDLERNKLWDTWWYFNTKAENLCFECHIWHFLIRLFWTWSDHQLNPRGCIFWKRLKLYVSSYKLAV